MLGFFCSADEDTFNNFDFPNKFLRISTPISCQNSTTQFTKSSSSDPFEFPGLVKIFSLNVNKMENNELPI